MNPIAPLLLLAALLALSLGACARDCGALVERRFQAAHLDEAACARLRDSVRDVPPQACEAVLQALESGARPR